MTGTFAFALVSLVATSAYLALFVSWHVLPTGYSPIRNAVSDYAVGKYGYLFRVGLWASSLGVLALACSLIAGVGAPPLATKDLVYLFLIPVSRIGMTLFPTDLEGERLSRTGRIHYLFAILAFTFTYLVISNMTSVLRDLDPAAWIRSSLKESAWAVTPELVLVVVTMIRPLRRRIFGLFERLFLLTTNVWFVIVAAQLLGRGR